MKMQNSFFGKTVLLTAGLFFTVIFLSSCKKDNPVHVPAAGLMAYNLAPDQEAIGLSVDNNNLFQTPLLYQNYSGVYLPLYTGDRTLRSFTYGGSNTLATTVANLADSAYYSLFVVGTSGEYENVFVQDKINQLPSNTGKAFIRYINAITGQDEHNIFINSGNDQIFNDNNKIGFVSDFQPVAPGDVSVLVSTNSVTDTTRTITLAKDGIYTVLISGVPGEKDNPKAISIKFVQIGNIIPD